MQTDDQHVESLMASMQDVAVPNMSDSYGASGDMQHMAGLVQSFEGTPQGVSGDMSGAMPDMPQADPMPESTLVALISQKMQQSHQWYGTGKMASQRIKADQYYRGEPLGNEVEGRSQVVSRDVAEAIDSIMPSLIRIFASGDEVVVMNPTRPDAEEAAKQATDYLNWVFLQQNDGFNILHTWFMDALKKKNGIVMAWYETRISRQKDSYKGLTEPQFMMLKNDPDYQMVECSSYPDQSAPPPQPQPVIDPQTGQPAINPQTGQPVMQPPPPPAMMYDCTVITAQPIKKLMVQNVPPDEFVIERRAASLETASFMARRRKMATSDLIELGYDKYMVMAIPRGDDHEYSSERIERFNDEDQLPYGNEGEGLDPSMRKVWITEAYLRVDYDGDGLAEWRKVTLAGDSSITSSAILSNEEISDNPFASLTPKPDQHRFYGYSFYDDTKDVQDVKTALMRGTLDSVYLANSPRLGAVTGQVNMDDLLDTRVGNIVRMTNPNAVVPLPTVNAAPQAMEMIGYWDQIREKRTGVATASAGLDPNILNSSATGANILNNNNQQRAELIARIFAETGVKRLFRLMFELICLHEDKPKTIKLRGKWIDVDPRAWKDRMDVTVSVGGGLGNRMEKMQTAISLLNLDEKIVQLQGGLQGPLLNAKNIYAKLEKVVDAAGYKTIEPYYMNPDNAPPPPPPKPDPELEKMKMEAQTKIAIANATNEAQAKGDYIRIQMESERDLALARLDSETKIVVAQIGAQRAMQDTSEQNAKEASKPDFGGLMATTTNELKQAFEGVQQTLGTVAESHGALAQAISKPKKVVTDEKGEIVGIE